jgi:hypothetical protein
LRNPVRAYRFGLDERSRIAVAVEEVERDQDDLTHREQAVIVRIEQADDENRRRPHHQLCRDLAARTPINRAAHAIGKGGVGAGGWHAYSLAAVLQRWVNAVNRAVHKRCADRRSKVASSVGLHTLAGRV